MLYFISNVKFKNNEIHSSENELRVSDNIFELISISDPYINKKHIYEVALQEDPVSNCTLGSHLTKSIKIVRKIETNELINNVKDFKQYWDIQSVRRKLIAKSFRTMLIIALMPIAVLVIFYMIIPLLYAILNN